MSHPEEVKQWYEEVSRQMAHLSKTQAMVLTLYSFGMVMTGRCGMTTIVSFLSLLLAVSPANLRQRLREWNYEAGHKRGAKRQAIEVRLSFAPLLGWILRDWVGTTQVVLALDVSYLGERLTILAISVVYRGCAIPVAWRILWGNTSGEWHPLWVELMGLLKAAIPPHYTVFALTDRGLYSKRLFQVLQQAGWHPLMRISTQGLCRRERAKTWKPLARLARPGMGIWCQRMVCFKGDPLVCTLLVQWDAIYDEPCLIVTDLPPAQVETNLYTLRAWIEAGFKDLKRGGLRWEQSKMTDPARVERLWLVMAVALLWLVRVGGVTQHFWQTLSPSPLPPATLSCPLLGWLTILVAALRHQPLPHGYFLPLTHAHDPPIIKYLPL
jgi:hypothetical protein